MVQCGLDARRYVVSRPTEDGSDSQTPSPYVMMWLCPVHIESVKKQGYVVVLDTSTTV
jgi:hypothetical protein